ncbi:MAG: host attachment protein [Cyanothece sp. SIO1E1]|nr:host attachment protein [Cyanothece sp. SIO1E1]
MNKIIVAVIDGTKARFLTLEPMPLPDYGSGPDLIEQESLHNQTKELQGQELWANTKTGRNRGASAQAHGYDDHRQNHMLEFERRFAQVIADKVLKLIQIHQARQLLLIAEPQILGIMRTALSSTLPKQLKVDELAKDLCQLKANELHRYLANRGLLPAYKRASTT